MSEIYVSVDIESDGPIPGPNSMLSFGAAAFQVDGEMISTFEANLELLEGAVGDPNTMKWWGTQPEAWKIARENLQSPQYAMLNFVNWVEKLPGKPVLIAYPALFDGMFLYWYSIKFVGRSPFSFSALDMKTMAMCLLKQDYRASTKKSFPKRWFGKIKHDHTALTDAKEQGEIFCNMLQDLYNG